MNFLLEVFWHYDEGVFDKPCEMITGKIQSYLTSSVLIRISRDGYFYELLCLPLENIQIKHHQRQVCSSVDPV